MTCLGLSAHAYNPLVHARDARTVGEVLTLAEKGRLGDIRGLGPARVAEIEAALVRAGFAVRHRHRR